MTIYYSQKSRTLKRLTLDQKSEVKKILSNSRALKTRKVDLKYRVNHSGQMFPIYSFQYGKGEERGKERILYTCVDHHCVVLDHVTEHDYQKVATMDRNFMRHWFADLKSGSLELVEIESENSVEVDNPPTTTNEADSSVWVPATFDGAGRLLQPSGQQQRVAFGEKTYPMIIEGVAGSGKTLVLNLTCHYLSQHQEESSEESTAPKLQLYYIYPNGASLLGEKMGREWAETEIGSSESLSQWDFHLASADEVLPLALKSQSVAALQQSFADFFEMKKKQRSKSGQKKHSSPSALELSWECLFESGLPVEIIFDYLIAVLVFRSCAELREIPLRDLISARGGLNTGIFDAIEHVYHETMSRPNWQELSQVFSLADKQFDMLLIDEAQNISFIALAYLLTHTGERRIIFSGDRNQAAKWDTISSLELVEVFLARRRLPYQKEHFEKHYRCPEDIWQYAKNRVLTMKEQIFGKEQYKKDASGAAACAEAGSEIGSEIRNAHYVKISEKKRGILAAFFENIPEMTADCFVITPSVASFEAFAEQYLGGKKFITLTPQQAAGLEVKNVVAFNPLNWAQIGRLEGNKSQKVRSKNLSEEEQQVYKQLNHFYVTLTRSTQSVLILESQASSRTSLRESAYEGLSDLSSRDEKNEYASFTPQALFDIYTKMGAERTEEGRGFFEKYGHYFKSVIENIVPAPLAQSESGKKSPQAARSQSIGDIISNLTTARMNCDALSQLSSSLIVKLLFEPYGKKKKQSLWDRLIEQMELQNNSPTTEKIVWAKFMRSSAVIAYLNTDFYQAVYPGTQMMIAQWLVTAHHDNAAHIELKKELVKKSLINITDLSLARGESSIAALMQDCDMHESRCAASGASPKLFSKSRVVSPTFSTVSDSKNAQTLSPKSKEVIFSSASSLPDGAKQDAVLKDEEKSNALIIHNKQQSREIVRSFIDAIINEPCNSDELNPFSEGFRKALGDFYRTLDPFGLWPIEERKKKIEDIIKRFCAIQPEFWALLTYKKYHALGALTGNQSLFIDFYDKSQSAKEPIQPTHLLLFNESVLQTAFDLVVRTYQDKKIDIKTMRDATTNIMQLLSIYSKNLPNEYESFKAPALVLLYRLIHKKNIFERSCMILKEMFCDDLYWDEERVRRSQQSIQMFAKEARDYEYAPLFRKLLDTMSTRENFSFFAQTRRLG